MTHTHTHTHTRARQSETAEQPTQQSSQNIDGGRGRKMAQSKHNCNQAKTSFKPITTEQQIEMATKKK